MSAADFVLKELDQLREQVTLLRDGLKRADDLLRHSYDHVSPLIREALAATEPKEQEYRGVHVAKKQGK